jgi:hypothetical protein
VTAPVPHPVGGQVFTPTREQMVAWVAEVLDPAGPGQVPEQLPPGMSWFRRGLPLPGVLDQVAWDTDRWRERPDGGDELVGARYPCSDGGQLLWLSHRRATVFARSATESALSIVCAAAITSAFPGVLFDLVAAGAGAPLTAALCRVWPRLPLTQPRPASAADSEATATPNLHDRAD